MSEFRKIAKISQVPLGKAVHIDLYGRDIALYRVEGRICATADTCMHEGASLGDEGTLEGCVVTCGWHGWQYDVRTGAALHDPEFKLDTYEVKVEGDDILVELD